MSFILEFFESQGWLGSIWKGMLFLIFSLVFVWIMAFIFSRTKLVIRDDTELKVHFGSLIVFSIYSVMVVLFLLLIAIHYKGLDISFWYTMPYLVILFVSFFIALDLSNKIQAKLSEIKSKRRK